MKKLFLLITVLLAAISVVAQSDLMSVRGISAGPGKLYAASSVVYGTTWGQCAGACTNQCMEAKQGTRDECDKMCFDKCHPQPDVITKRLPPVQISQPMPVKEDCSSVCRRLASKSPVSYSAGSNFEVFMTCMQDRCKQDCESSCRMMYGRAAQDCIQKECVSQVPQTCEDGCKLIADECQKAGIDDKTCEKKIRDCYRKCQPQVPQTCEDGCKIVADECQKTGADPQVCQKKIRDCLRGCQPQCPSCPECPPAEMPCQERCKIVADECQNAGVDEKSCQMKIRACLRECQPQPEYPPAGGCDTNCADGYHKCSEIAKTMKAEAGDPATVLEYYMMKCRKGVAECLDSCRPTGPPGQPDMNAVNPRLPNRKEMVGLNPQPEPPMPAPETGDVSLLGRIWHIFSG